MPSIHFSFDTPTTCHGLFLAVNLCFFDFYLVSFVFTANILSKLKLKKCLSSQLLLFISFVFWTCKKIELKTLEFYYYIVCYIYVSGFSQKSRPSQGIHPKTHPLANSNTQNNHIIVRWRSNLKDLMRS